VSRKSGAIVKRTAVELRATKEASALSRDPDDAMEEIDLVDRRDAEDSALEAAIIQFETQEEPSEAEIGFAVKVHHHFASSATYSLARLQMHARRGPSR
jgi:hypothetical protein